MLNKISFEKRLSFFVAVAGVLLLDRMREFFKTRTTLLWIIAGAIFCAVESGLIYFLILN